MSAEPKQYKDIAGNPCSLDWLVKNEPEWAANQIRHRDKIETELKTAQKRIEVLEERMAQIREICRRSEAIQNQHINT